MKSFGLVLVFSISLLFATKVKAQGSVEQSSPEESYPSSLSGLDLLPHTQDPGFEPPTGSVLPQMNSGLSSQSTSSADLLPKEMWPTFGPSFDIEQPRNGDLANINDINDAQINPLLTAGVFPYQIDPVSAFIAASVTMAVQSIRETGTVDPRAIALIMNDTDFHAGWIGAAAAAYTKRQGTQALGWVGARLTPRFLENILRTQTARHVGMIANSLTYTVAVTSGYEYFTQFWRLATYQIPNVDTVTDLINAPRRDQIRVLSNLLQYVANENVQKRITSSVYNHRIMTFEFLAMNVGMFLGYVAGAVISDRVLAAPAPGVKQSFGRFMAGYLSRVGGAVLGGIVFQFIPEGFRMSVNDRLLEWKIDNNEDQLDHLLARIEEGIEHKLYPAHHADGVGSFFLTQLDLQSDVEALIRRRDMLFSLYAQKLFVLGESDEAETAIRDVQASVIRRMISFSRMSGASQNLIDQDDGSSRFLSPQELEEMVYTRMQRDIYQSHYLSVLGAAIDRMEDSWEDYQEFLESLEDFQELQQESLHASAE